MRHRICVISLAVPIELDGRVQRQVEYLAPNYHITYIGYGKMPDAWTEVEWRPVDRSDSLPRQMIDRLLLAGGRIITPLYDLWFETRRRYQQGFAYVLDARPDLILVNDWAALAFGARAAEQLGVPLIFDMHEYWALENETSRLWMMFFAPMIRHFLRKHAPKVSASITVSAPIARRYHADHSIDPILLYNAPKPAQVIQHALDPDHIKLIYHGAAGRNRHLETMIDAAAITDPRYHLYLMLVTTTNGDYVDELKQYAERSAPGRVTFLSSVPPTEIVQTIADYDMELAFIPPTTYNYEMAMPNKLFEALAAGLAVCVGPSLAMAEFVREHRCGVVTPDFTAAGLAETLNHLSPSEIDALRRAAYVLGGQINADTEMAKLTDLCRHLLAGQREGAQS